MTRTDIGGVSSRHGTSVKASTTPVAAASTRERIIRRAADADQNDCCRCSEGISEIWPFSDTIRGSNNVRSERSAP